MKFTRVIIGHLAMSPCSTMCLPGIELLNPSIEFCLFVWILKYKLHTAQAGSQQRVGPSPHLAPSLSRISVSPGNYTWKPSHMLLVDLLLRWGVERLLDDALNMRVQKVVPLELEEHVQQQREDLVLHDGGGHGRTVRVNHHYEEVGYRQARHPDGLILCQTLKYLFFII